MRGAAFGALSLIALATCSLMPRTIGSIGNGGGEIHHVPVVTEEGDRLGLTLRLCRPAGPGPFALAILNHDGAKDDDAREGMSPARCDDPAVTFFLTRDYAVVLPLRRGFGDSESNWVANPGPCAKPDYVQAGLAGARDIEAALGWAAALPNIKVGGFVIMGAGEGGWATLAYTARPDRRIGVAVVIAAGMGANAGGVAGRTCRPDLLAEAAASFGATSRMDMLWIYPKADRSYSAELVATLANAFRQAGGKATLARPDAAIPAAGDWIASQPETAMWQGLVADFLKQ